MPSTYLYGINNEGRIFGLSTTGNMWREFIYLGLEFKRLSAVSHFMWAIGGDRQVYVHVHGLDIPIRIKEETWENERWLPIEGFGDRLLPTDRYHFSNIDGTIDRSRDKVKLPSMAWQWEGDWTIETTLDGQPLDHDGWTYAVDFPAKYTPIKKWKSCVRRRKWVRYRRYSAMNSWCAIAPLHKDPTKEPFIDVSIGGYQIPGTSNGQLSVWAVTAHGRLMYRYGVTTTSPEGIRWNSIKLINGHEVIQVSVGTTGLVWAILNDGRAITRTGITRQNPIGDDWSIIDIPKKNIKLIQISVGYNSVWAITNDYTVWFRKGINGDMSGVDVQCATGNGWIEMSNKMAVISVTSNDYVFGIGYDDRYLYYRTGINKTELTGKKWRLINVPLQLSRASSNASLSSSNRHSLCGTPKLINDYYQNWNSSLNKSPNNISCSSSSGGGGGGAHGIGSSNNSNVGSVGGNSNDNDNIKTTINNINEQSRSAPTPTSLKLWQKNDNDNSNKKIASCDELLSDIVGNIKISNESLSHSCESTIVIGKGMDSTIKVNPAAWSPVHSVGSMVGVEAHPETDDSIFDPDLSGNSGIYGDDEHTNGIYWTDNDVLWCNIEAGACIIDTINLPKWLNDNNNNNNNNNNSNNNTTTMITNNNNNINNEINELWRLTILNKLKKRLSNINYDTNNYVNAIEHSSWIKNGDARYKLKCTTNNYDDCIIELEWISSNSDKYDTGTLTILNSNGATTITQFSVTDIKCVVCCSEPGIPRISIHTPKLKKLKVLYLQFSTDTEMEDWIGHITLVTCKINNVYGRPGKNSIWTTTSLGDIYVYDPIIDESNQLNNDNTYTKELLDINNYNNKNIPFECLLQNGFSINSSLNITAYIHDDADRLSFNLVCHMSTINNKNKNNDTHDVALHFNPRLNENIIVRNTYKNNKWGDEERDDNVLFKKSTNINIIINCEKNGYRIFINNTEYTYYNHRIIPDNITHLKIKGFMTINKILYKSNNIIIEPITMFWRQIGGHLRKVLTCQSGVTWGIGYDNTPWVYTGGWGGLYLKFNDSQNDINTMTDTHNYYVYENQRWNPVTGYTNHGLPTDRPMWSDVTGKYKRTKEHTKLLSMHWRWLSDWIIDFHTPGGVDRDGWQYATDFPSQYHSKKQFTDYVRRRRWFRKCLLTTSGPWKELGNTKIIDLSLYSSFDNGIDGPIDVWAIAVNGEALYRHGVSESSPFGITWEHIPSDQPLISISCGPHGQVWAVGKNGTSYWRFGITQNKPIGDLWTNVEPPSGAKLKQLSVGCNVVWAIDYNGKLYVRKEIQPKIFPEGTHWQTLPSMPNDPIHIDMSVTTAKQGFRSVSVSPDNGQVWAISGAGIVCRRIGITNDNPAGHYWTTGIGANWQSISVSSLTNGTTKSSH
ncbi:hypothetical protein HCN44_007115 [Aphidius gifuensis]|uniref:Galectin domain-containing protein n=1 Tax=Aphidius gifuensis TaxID=684658 RepID=A0A835CQ49_APHGI|nr:tectonin beta-propeller repeat-containing protein [Aphidius gifuensis]KAF7988805.1 hypothetical protein HCN44_007115 [Aphidius gifuensis]